MPFREDRLQRAGEEGRNLNATFSVRALQLERRIERDHGGEPIRGRIGMRQAAADGAAVAHRAIGDGAGDMRQQPGGDIGYPSVLDLSVRHAGADGEHVVLDRRLAQLVEARDINDVLGLRQSKIEQGTERLSSRDDARVLRGLVESTDRVREQLGAKICELRGLHGYIV